MADDNDDAGFELDDGVLENTGIDILEEDGAGAAVAAPAAGPTADESHEILYKYHPETIIRYAETIDPLVPLKAAPPTAALDEHHTSPPFLTVYERTKILGTRANQLADGARPYIHPIPEHITAPLEIAKLELENRALPFIVERPMPDGSFEYWRLSDLMIL